jgi:type IV pilus assembly protein PilC
MQRGECAAPGLVEAADQLRARGLAPLSLDRIDPEPLTGLPATADAFTLFNRNLAEMTSIGLPLPRAIQEISSGLRRGRFKRGLEQVEASLREGRPLDEAVEQAPGIFPPYYRCMLKAGAASGNLPGVLSAVARNTEGVRMARRALLEALLYPMLIVLAALLLGALIMTFFVPFYRDFCDQYGFHFPIALDLFLRAFGSAAKVSASAAAISLGVAGVVLFLRRTVVGERFLGRLPLVGRIRRHLMTARLLGALGVMLRSRVPFSRALPVALGAAGSLELDHVTARLAQRASDGRRIGDVLSEAPVVSREVAAFLTLAERSGDAPEATLQVADLLTEQARAESEALYIILMPVALVVAGVVVGSCLVGAVRPYIQLLESFRP